MASATVALYRSTACRVFSTTRGVNAALVGEHHDGDDLVFFGGLQVQVGAALVLELDDAIAM